MDRLFCGEVPFRGAGIAERQLKPQSLALRVGRKRTHFADSPSDGAKALVLRLENSLTYFRQFPAHPLDLSDQNGRGRPRLVFPVGVVAA